MNAVYYLRAAHARGEEVGQGDDGRRRAEQQAVQRLRAADDPLSQFFAWPSTTWTPRVLKDGSDSVGALGALNRVYLNIGLFSEEWLLHFRAAASAASRSRRFRSPRRERNSVYWRATEMQTPNMARFFLASTDPHYLKDAPGGQQPISTRTPRRSSAARSSSPSAAPGATRASCRRCRPASISRTPTARTI